MEEVLDSYTEEEIRERDEHDGHRPLRGTCRIEGVPYGSDNPLSSYDNPLGGNRIIARGSIGRWDGTRHGLTVYRDFDDMMRPRFCSPRIVKSARSGMRTGGRSSSTGHHHDGGVDVEVRQLTDAGEVGTGMSSRTRGTASRSPAAEG